jgi:nitroreductase
MTTSKPVDAATVTENLNWRYAVKKFDATRKIPAATWSALEQATIASPSSYGLQPWKFVVVNDPAIRAKLRPVSWNQSQITDASHLMVFCGRTEMSRKHADRLIDRMVEVRGTPVAALEDYRKMMHGTLKQFEEGGDPKPWASRQVYIALGFFLFAAAQMGIDTCPMEGIDANQYDEILGLKGTGFGTVVVATAGYRAGDDWLANLKKVRYPESEVLERR